MSFSWPALQITLEHVFKSATGITFVWEDEPRAALVKPYGVLSLGQSISIGRDYSRYTFRDSDTSIDIFGFRELTVTCQVFSRQIKGEETSRALIEKARLMLANPIYRDELRSAGLIFVETSPVLDLDFTFQNRAENRSSFDVVFRLMLHEQANTKVITYFDSVSISENIL